MLKMRKKRCPSLLISRSSRNACRSVCPCPSVQGSQNCSPVLMMISHNVVNCLIGRCKQAWRLKAQGLHRECSSWGGTIQWPAGHVAVGGKVQANLPG